MGQIDHPKLPDPALKLEIMKSLVSLVIIALISAADIPAYAQGIADSSRVALASIGTLGAYAPVKLLALRRNCAAVNFIALFHDDPAEGEKAVHDICNEEFGCRMVKRGNGDAKCAVARGTLGFLEFREDLHAFCAKNGGRHCSNHALCRKSWRDANKCKADVPYALRRVHLGRAGILDHQLVQVPSDINDLGFGKKLTFHHLPNGDVLIGHRSFNTWDTPGAIISNQPNRMIALYDKSLSKLAKYDGMHSMAVPNGLGQGTFVDGWVYSGEWSGGIAQGEGDIKANMYAGELRNGLRHGKGTCKLENGTITYTGEWQNNRRHGNGTSMENGFVVYDGEWRNDKRHGTGTYNFRNGDVYNGQYENGLRHGLGRYTYSNGDYVVGQWKESKRFGDHPKFNLNGEFVGTLTSEWDDDEEQASQCDPNGETGVNQRRITSD